MRLIYSLGLFGYVTLVSLAGAQTLPPKQQTTPIQPVPTGNTKIQPIPATQVGMYPPTLYQMNDVSKALKLNQDQLTRLNGVSEKLQGQYRDEYAKLAALPEGDRFARLRELNQLYGADWSKSTADIFNADQRLRYQQLTRQYDGFNALYEPDVQKRLNLTPEQVDSLRANAAWSAQRYSVITGAGQTDAEKRAALYADYRKEYSERFNKLLTADQQKIWREMTGDPYTFQMPR